MAFPTGWSYYKEATLTGASAANLPLDLRVWAEKPPVTFTEDTQADGDCNSSQGVCTSDDGTTFFTTGGNLANRDNRTTIYRYTRSGNTYTLSGSPSSRVLHSATGAPTDVQQVNSLFYNAADGLIYAGANNFENGDDTGWIIRIDPSDLTIVDYVEITDGAVATAEGCCIAHGYLWQTFHDYWGVYRYTITTATEGSFALSSPTKFAFPSTPTGGLGQQVAFHGDIMYLNVHESSSRQGIHSYLWDGTGFDWIGLFDAPTSDCTQGFVIDGAGDAWFAERQPPEGGNRIVKATLDVEPGNIGLDGDGAATDFADVRITDDAGTTVVCGGGAGWREYVDGNELFAWFSYANPYTATDNIRVYYGNASPGTWSDDPTDVTTLLNNFNDGTVEDFDTTYNTTTPGVQSADPLEGAYSFSQTGTGGNYPGTATFISSNAKRIVFWSRPDATTETYLNRNPGAGNKRATTQIISGSSVKAGTSAAVTVTGIDPDDWTRMEVDYDYDNSEYQVRAWVQNGAGFLAETAELALQSNSPAYRDVLLFKAGDWDLIYSRDTQASLPVLGPFGARTNVPVVTGSPYHSGMSLMGAGV